MRTTRPIWMSVVAGLLAATAADATVYYISPTGSASAVGTSAAAPWSLAKANASLVPGDVCMVMPGTYSAVPKPANATGGTSGTPGGARITFVGNLLSPGDAVFTGDCELYTSDVTLKGIALTGSMNLSGRTDFGVAQYDSVAWCNCKGAYFDGSKHNVITRCTITNSAPFSSAAIGFVYSSWAVPPTAYPMEQNSEYDTLSYNIVDLGTITWRGFIMRVDAQHNYIKGNQFHGLFTGASPDVAGRYLYNSPFNRFEDNRWTYEATGDSAGSPWDCSGLRDSSNDVVFLRDSILAGLQNGHTFQGRLINSGAINGIGQAESDLCTNIRYQGCYYYLHDGYMLYQNNANGLVLDHSVFASTSSPALFLTTNLGVFTMNHCTAFAGSGRAVEAVGTIISGTPTDSVRFTSNLFYSAATGTTSGVVKFPGASGFRSSSNVFYTPSYASTPGDLAANWLGLTGSLASWCAASGNDCDSHFGDPLFVNANPGSLNLHLGTGSAAIGAAAGGTDAGAFPFTGTGSDVTPPAAVTDLAAINVASTSLTLQWTAPGDDGMSGQASAYDLRYSQSPITAANFASATSLTVASPVAAGSQQTDVVLGLTLGRTYYFALMTEDAAGNWSALSNVASATTVDRTPPASIHDLTAH